MATLPIIDLRTPASQVASQLASACRELGFFYVVGHRVDPALVQQLSSLSHRFFALPEALKARYAMSHGGRAWRGWFPLGGSLLPDAQTGRRDFTSAASFPIPIRWCRPKRRCTDPT